MKKIKAKCPYCSETEWRFLQFGDGTNYFQCQTCFCLTPPKETKALAVAELRKLNCCYDINNKNKGD